MSDVPPQAIIPPPRSLIFVKPATAEEGGGILIGCDCATTTQLIIEGADELTETREMAFTCDGCHSVHWFTIGPQADVERFLNGATVAEDVRDERWRDAAS